MDMWNVIAMSFSFSAVLILLFCTTMQRRKRKKNKTREDRALKGIAAGIGDRLHAANPGSKWKWICRPNEFAINGGIARIEVLYLSGEEQFVDVCMSSKGYMTLHVLNITELTKPDGEPIPIDIDVEYPADTDEASTSSASAAPKIGLRPNDEESVGKWYNIVLIDVLTSLINDLNANGEVCLQIDKDGKAYVEENGGITVVYDFGEMPDVSLWEHITEKLGLAGLFAEVREENCIFISWA